MTACSRPRASWCPKPTPPHSRISRATLCAFPITSSTRPMPRHSVRPPPSRPRTSGPLRELNQRIAQLKTQVAADKDGVAQLTKQAAASDTAADQLALAQAQQELNQDDLDDAQEDLARQGGDRHAVLEQALQQHEATHQAPSSRPLPRPPAS